MGWSWRVADNKNAIINSSVILISYCLNSNLKFRRGCNLKYHLSYFNFAWLHKYARDTLSFLQYAHLINVEHNE